MFMERTERTERYFRLISNSHREMKIIRKVRSVRSVRSVGFKNTGVLMAQQQKQDPSPEQITAACLQIQATWSPDERLRRLRVDWRPMVSTADGRLVSVTADDYDTHMKTPFAQCGRADVFLTRDDDDE